MLLAQNRNAMYPVSVRGCAVAVSLVLLYSYAYSQEYVELPSTAVFESKESQPAILNMRASLIDGLTYRLPCEIKPSSHVELVKLSGTTICRCVSLKLEKDHATAGSPAKGFIYLKPKGELRQTLDVHGVKRDSGELLSIGKLQIESVVFAPIQVTPIRLEVKEGKLVEEKLTIQSASNVQIESVTIRDSLSLIDCRVDPAKTEVKLAQEKLIEKAGELELHFDFTYENVKGHYQQAVAYGPKRGPRVIPPTVVLRVEGSEEVARVAVLGLNPEHGNEAMVSVYAVDAKGNRLDGELNAVIETFESNLATIKISIPKGEQRPVSHFVRWRISIRSQNENKVDVVDAVDFTLAD